MAFTVVKSYRATIGTTPVAVTVPANRLATVYHYGINAAGTASTGALYADTEGGTPLTDNADGEGLHTILSGVSYPLPPGTTTFNIRAATADTLVQVTCSEKKASNANYGGDYY